MNFGLQLGLVAGVACAMLAAATSGGERAGKAGSVKAAAKVRDEPRAPAPGTPPPAGANGGGGGGARVMLAGDDWATRLNRLSGGLGDDAGWARIVGRAVESGGVLTVDWSIAGRDAAVDCGRISVAGTDAPAVIDEAAAGFRLAARDSAARGSPSCG